jgi:hypothetical protein
MDIVLLMLSFALASLRRTHRGGDPSDRGILRMKQGNVNSADELHGAPLSQVHRNQQGRLDSTQGEILSERVTISQFSVNINDTKR